MNTIFLFVYTLQAQKANEVALEEVITTQPRDKQTNLRHQKRPSLANVHDTGNGTFIHYPMNEQKRDRSRSKNSHAKKAKRKVIPPTNTERVKTTTTRPPLLRSLTIE